MQQPDKHAYGVNLSWKEGRIGEMSAPDIPETIEVATPPQFPGGIEGVWSPEHLFTASIVSCFFTSFTAIAKNSKFDFVDLDIESSGVMSREDGKFVMSEVVLKPVLTISDESKEKKAYRLLEKAEQICLITRSVKSKIIVEPTVYVTQEVG